MFTLSHSVNDVLLGLGRRQRSRVRAWEQKGDAGAQETALLKLNREALQSVTMGLSCELFAARMLHHALPTHISMVMRKPVTARRPSQCDPGYGISFLIISLSRARALCLLGSRTRASQSDRVLRVKPRHNVERYKSEDRVCRLRGTRGSVVLETHHDLPRQPH